MAIKYFVVCKEESRVFTIIGKHVNVSEGYKSPYTKLLLFAGCREEAFPKRSQDYMKSKDHPMQMIFDVLYGSPIIPI
jgi:hypothetical protein